MINSIVKLSHYRKDIQTRKVKESASEVTEKHQDWEQAKFALEEFKQWQLDETQRLFEELALNPATTEQLKNYNARLAAFKSQLNDLIKALNNAESLYQTAQQQLKQEIRELQKLQLKTEKYDYLSNHVEQLEKREQQQNEENLSADEAEEMRAARQSCSCEI